MCAFNRCAPSPFWGQLHVPPWGQLHVSPWGQLHAFLSSSWDEICCLTVKHSTKHMDVVDRLNMFKSRLAVMAAHVWAHQCIHHNQHTYESNGGETACTFRVCNITTHAWLTGPVLASATCVHGGFRFGLGFGISNMCSWRFCGRKVAADMCCSVCMLFVQVDMPVLYNMLACQ